MTLLEHVAKLHQLARQTDSFAFRFFYRDDLPEFDPLDPDAPLVQVFVEQDGAYTLTACDRAGRPYREGAPEDEGPFTAGRGEVRPEGSLYDQIAAELLAGRRRGERRKGERRRWFKR